MDFQASDFHILDTLVTFTGRHGVYEFKENVFMRKLLFKYIY